MAHKTILELETETGIASFLLVRVRQKEKIIVETTFGDQETGKLPPRIRVFDSLEEAIRRFVQRNHTRPRLCIQYMHPAYSTVLTMYLNKELNSLSHGDSQSLTVASSISPLEKSLSAYRRRG